MGFGEGYYAGKNRRPDERKVQVERLDRTERSALPVIKIKLLECD
jgi:hypothetical protein